MKLTKQRVEAFSDGVIAIIITVMVLNIPLPDTFDFSSVIGLLAAIFVYFLSFIVVAAFWNQHHRIFSYLDEVSSKVIAFNMLFLFFLSLIPILTKWVMDNPGILIPVIGYDAIYLLTVLSYMFIFNTVIKSRTHEEITKMQELRLQSRQKRAESRKSHEDIHRAILIRFIITALAIIAMIVISIVIPKTSTVFLLGLPVISSIANLLFDDHKHKDTPQKQGSDK